jgi:hypothetical protein
MGKVEPSCDLNDQTDLQYSDYNDDEFEKRRETRFLFKLDACLMTWAWLAYLIKVGPSIISYYDLLVANG